MTRKIASKEIKCPNCDYVLGYVLEAGYYDLNGLILIQNHCGSAYFHNGVVGKCIHCGQHVVVEEEFIDVEKESKPNGQPKTSN